jgi:hypothetical protein
VPEATAVPFLDAVAAAGVADVLAWEPGAHEVDACGGLPANGGDVAEVRDVRVVVGEDRRGAGIGVGYPGELATEHLLYGRVEAAVSGAHGADSQGVHAAVSHLFAVFSVMPMR